MSTRTLTFPDESVGTVEEIHSGRKVPAAGAVEVDAAQPIRLMLERQHAQVLHSLGPDDIQGLYLWGEKNLKPATIELLGRLTGLIELHAPHKGSWDDHACEVISQLTGLKGLGILRGYGVTDAGFGLLSRLTGLMTLRVEQSQITGAALSALAEMTSLSSLNLDWARRLDDRGVPAIGRRTGLTWLCLDGTAISDEGMPHLGDLHALKVLFLGSTQVTPDGLRHLPANDPAIRVLYSLGRTPLSRSQWVDLDEALPHLDFGGVRELTVDPSTRQRVREHGTPLAGFSVPDDSPLLAIFTTDHCVPCERMLPVVQGLGKSWQDRMATVQIHSPDHPEIAQALNILKAPSLVLFTGAERAVRLEGSAVLDELKAELSPYLGLAVR